MRAVRSWLGDPVAAGVASGVILALIELALVGGLGRPGLVGAVVALFAVTGALAGACIAITCPLALRLGLGRLPGAALIALPTLLVSVPLGRTLFQGAYAETLPGAGVAPIAVPVIVWLATAITVALGSALLAARPRARVPLAIGLALLGAILDGANRTMFRSGYPELHTTLTVAAIVLGALALGYGVGQAPHGWRVRAATAVVVVVAGVGGALWGLEDAEDRRVVVTRGDDARHLVNAARALVDLDGDGHSAILGGGDCDEGDAARFGGARDVPGNGKDEDCDGVDAVPRKVVVDQDAVRSLEAWRARPEIVETLRRTRAMNLLIISIDTVRADQLARDAAGRAAFPNLAALLDGSISFTRAFAPGAGTDISLTTFVTGRWNPFQPIATTLPEALAGTGRLTHVILPREVLRYAGETLLTRGQATFDRLVTDGSRRDIGDRISAGATTDRALGFLDRAGGNRFALWVHYFDVHEHRQLDVPAAALAAVDDTGRGQVAHRYRALLKIVDGEVGRLLADLERRGLADDTVIVLFSDHGESLGEDARLPDNHGLVVYQALTHVPVAVRVPGVAGRVDDTPVSLVDLAPTLLGVLGAAAGAMAPLDGVDLTPHLLGAPRELVRSDRALVMNEQDQWGVVVWPLKLLVRPKDDLTELYDLSADPAERRDLAAARPDDVKALRARYGEFPAVPMDRTQKGRRWREAQAQPPPRPRSP